MASIESIGGTATGAHVVGVLDYAVWTKRKPMGPRDGRGNQAAVFLETSDGTRVWFGIREPFCEMKTKNTVSSDAPMDEFGIAMLWAYAIDVLLDAGFVPSTAVVEVDLEAYKERDLVCAFEELGAVNVLEQLPDRRILGVVQSTLGESVEQVPFSPTHL